MKRRDHAFALAVAAGLSLYSQQLFAQNAQQNPDAPAAMSTVPAQAGNAPADAPAATEGPGKANAGAAAQSPEQAADANSAAQGTQPALAEAPNTEQAAPLSPTAKTQTDDNQNAQSNTPAASSDPASGGQPAGQSPAAAAQNPAPKNDEPAAQTAQPAPEPAPLDPKNVTLKIATWGGAYGESQDRAYFKPFTARFGYQIEPVTYDGSYDALKAQAGSPKWSLVDLDGHSAAQGCKEQLLEPFDPAFLENAPNGATISEDFDAGAIRPCAVASVAWSAVIVYDKRSKRQPESLNDFFNVRAFPGKRALPRQPKYPLELALMADGVAPSDVYAVLATPEGQDRAFAKLSSIKDDIVWWEKPADIFRLIVKKEAAMGLGFNGRAFMAIVGAHEPVGILWDHQIYSFDYWAIPRSAPHQDAARAFIRFATSPGPLSDQTRWLPYGPARRSAVQLVSKHAELDLDMKPFLPTFEPNRKVALALDESWWAANGKALGERFADWIEGRRQLPPQRDSTTAQ